MKMKQPKAYKLQNYHNPSWDNLLFMNKNEMNIISILKGKIL